MQLNNRLRHLRQSHGLTMKELAEKSGLSLPFISGIEHGRATPSIKTLLALCAVFNLSLVDLLAGVEFEGISGDIEQPDTLREFLNHPDFRDEVDADWAALLAKIQLRGHYPATVKQWMGIYLYLKQIFAPD
jgi:transcriptional regulator with XRE-family HTH domain